MKTLEDLVGCRFENIIKLKQAIEKVTGHTVSYITESQSEHIEGCDYEIDYEFENNYGAVETMWYLKDGAGRYYITEV